MLHAHQLPDAPRWLRVEAVQPDAKGSRVMRESIEPAAAQAYKDPVIIRRKLGSRTFIGGV